MTRLADPPRIVFHAGFHKTGTSSLQSALRAHRVALAPLFAVETRASSPTLLAAAEAARAYSLDVGQGAALDTALTDWTASLVLQPGQGLLASCEDFAGHIPGRFGVADYRAAVPIARAVCTALHGRFPDWPLTLLYTTRDAAGWLRSIHWQLSKHDELTQGPNRFARTHANAADFGAVLANLRTALPAVRVIDASLADLSPRRLGPVEALYDAAGLPDALRAQLPAQPPSNQAPPHDLARVFVRLNRSDLPRDKIYRMKRDMLAAGELLLGDE